LSPARNSLHAIVKHGFCGNVNLVVEDDELQYILNIE